MVQAYAKIVLLLFAFVPGPLIFGSGAVEFVPAGVLQSDAHVQPWPERRAAVAEWQVGGFGIQCAVRAPGERAVKRCIGGAADRHPSRREAPGVVVDVGSRDIEAPQPIIGIVGEPERSGWRSVLWFSWTHAGPERHRVRVAGRY